MKISTVYADYPLISGIGKERVRGNVRISGVLSPLTFKLVLLKERRRFIRSSDVRVITKVHPTYVSLKAVTEMEKCNISGAPVFKAEIKPFGREKRLQFAVNHNYLSLSQGTMEIPDELIYKTSNSTPYELLLVLLAYRYQKKNYLDFLLEYFLGVPFEVLDNLKGKRDSARVREKVRRVFNSIISASEKLGIKIDFKTERIPVGVYTTEWFTYIEIKE